MSLILSKNLSTVPYWLALKKNCVYYSSTIDETDLKEFDFLKKKAPMTMPPPIDTPRGLNTAKKEAICKNLEPLMPAHHRAFWNELPSSDDSKDLLDTQT